MIRRTALLAVSLLLAANSMGCLSRAIGEAVEGVMGPKGVYKEYQVTLGAEDARPLGEYQNFQPGLFEDDFGGQVPKELFEKIDAYTARALANQNLPVDKTGQTAVINGRVFYYEDASVAGHLFGPFEEVIAEVQLVDKSSGRVIGQAICIGRTTKSVRKGVDNKTLGLANAIADWVSSRFPEETGRVEYTEEQKEEIMTNAR